MPTATRDGFAYTEDFVRKVNEAIAEADAGEVVSHEEVMAQAKATVAAHAAKRKQAA